MAKASLELQAAAVRKALSGKLTLPEQRAVVQAGKTLDALAGLRKTCLEGAAKDEDSTFSDRVAKEIAEILGLPTDE